MNKAIDAHEARVHFGQLLDEVSEKDYTFFVKRRGKVAAVILNPEDYRDMLEIGAEQSDPEIKRALAEGKKQFELGEVGAEEDILKILRGGEIGRAYRLISSKFPSSPCLPPPQDPSSGARICCPLGRLSFPSHKKP
ncbi:MAG: type II toxin-antitoxin system Phd/YefM family antitoxin [Actinomycetota bacterium]|nr:type II toxin-antitoxin system Phd/YefM family antitoxin [Actinomycetota bacterium]